MLVLPRIQPIEFVKPFLIVIISMIICSQKYTNFNLKYFLSFLLTILISSFLILQPDIGQTLLVVFSCAVLIFTSGISIFLLVGFSIFAFMVGLFFIFLREKLLENPKEISDLVKNISGILIGFISIPLGIGGGSLMVPFMRTFGYDIRKSIGTAAAVGFLIAVTGTITMITGGKIIDNVNTPFSLGYINLLGFIVFVPVTMIMARLGAKAVYKIDKKILSKIFGTFLILVSIRSFLEYLSIN